MAAARRPRARGGGPRTACTVRARNSCNPLTRQASARPASTRRGQKAGLNCPGGATSPRPREASSSITATATPASGAAARRSAVTRLLLQPELSDEPVERVHLALREAREVLGAHVGIGREVPLVRELLPLRRVHRLPESVGEHTNAVRRRAL